MVDGPVYYFTRILPGYRVPVLEALDSRLQGRLIVCHGDPPAGSSLASIVAARTTSFERLHLKNYWVRGESVHIQPFGNAFRKFGRPAAVLAEESPHSIFLPLLLAAARRHGAGRVLWGHFSSLDRPFEPERNLRDRYRLWLARSVEACACYSEGIARMLGQYLSRDQLFVARNTIDMGPLFAQYDELGRLGKKEVRRQLSLPEDAPVLVFLGRLTPEKGTDLLLETFARVRRDGPAVLVVIGDGPERSRMEKVAVRDFRKDVRFLGALEMGNEQAASYLYAADAMLMPGALGLVINHAFAFGLPVVSCRRPIGSMKHGPEIEYVRSGENGFLSDNCTSEDLYEAIRTVLRDLDRFASNAARFAREELGVDKMVDGLYEAIAHAVSAAE